MVWMIDQAFEIKPKSLCTFFWALVASIVLTLPAYPVLLYNIYVDKIKKIRCGTLHYGFGLLFTSFSLLSSQCYFAHYYLRNDYSFTTVVVTSPIFLVVIAVGVAAFVGLIFAFIWFTDQMRKRSIEIYRAKLIHGTTKIKKEKKPNVIIEYIRAKKQKICPIIEYED